MLTADWLVVPMHIKSSDPDPTGRFNEGLSVAALLDGLRASPGRGEITSYNGLADVTAARQELATSAAPSAPVAAADGVLAAAVRWNVDPATLSKKVRERVGRSAASARSAR